MLVTCLRTLLRREPVAPADDLALNGDEAAALQPGDVLAHRFVFGVDPAGASRLLVTSHAVVYLGCDGTARRFPIQQLTGLRAWPDAVRLCFRHAAARQQADSHVVIAETVPRGFRSTFELEMALAEAWIRRTGQPFPAADLATCTHVQERAEPGSVAVLGLPRLGAVAC